MDLEQFVAVLTADYQKLEVRIRKIFHTVECECKGVTLRLHVPTVSQGQAKIAELVELLLDYMTTFALPRAELKAVSDKYGKITEEEYRIKRERLHREAIDLFIKANRATNRNGEAGELLLYLLTEWILEAPQLIAKLPLKTDPNMPVFGSDGIHFGYSKKHKNLILYTGEAKLVADVGRAIAEAAKSIAKMLAPDSMRHELRLVRRNLDFSGINESQKALLLSYLDPNEDHENYNKRIDVITCLVGFDFAGYRKLSPTCGDDELSKLVRIELEKWSAKIAADFTSSGINTRTAEIFLFPLPSVQTLRDLFQQRIGWNNDAGAS